MSQFAAGRGKVIALSVALAVALLALLPGAWSAAVAQTGGTPTGTGTPTATSTEVAAGETATFEAGGATITIDGETFDTDTLISFTPIIMPGFDDLDPEQLGAIIEEVLELLGIEEGPVGVTDGTSLVVAIFDLSALRPDGVEADFNQPVTYSTPITDEMLAAAGGNPNNISLQFFDEDTGQWTRVACSATNDTLTCDLPHFSIWALVIEVGGDGGAVPAPADTGTGLVEDAGGTSVGWLVAALVAVAAVGGAGARMMTSRARR